MSSETTPSIKLTPATVGFALSMFALAAIGWNGVGYFKAGEQKDAQQDMRLDQAEKSATQTDSKLDRLSEKVDQTKEAVIKLTTVIEQNGLTKKANRIPLPDDNILVTPTEFVIQK